MNRNARRWLAAGAVMTALLVFAVGAARLRHDDDGVQVRTAAAAAPSTTAAPTAGSVDSTSTVEPLGTEAPTTIDAPPPVIDLVPTTQPSTPPPTNAPVTSRAPSAPGAPTSQAAVGPAAPVTSTEPPRPLDGSVTVSVTPSSRHVTLDDRLFFDVVVHNGTAEVLHGLERQCDVLVSTDRSNWVGGRMFDGTASGLVRALDDQSGTETPAFARDESSLGRPHRQSDVRCPPVDVAPGTDLHERLAWDVALSAVPAGSEIYVRAWFQYQSGPSAAIEQPVSEIQAIGVDDEPLRASSRTAAIDAAFADPRMPAHTGMIQGGAWYHAGRWIVEVYPFDPNAPDPLQGWWLTVDAATARVVSVQSS